jgi:hypothetical protein
VTAAAQALNDGAKQTEFAENKEANGSRIRRQRQNAWGVGNRAKGAESPAQKNCCWGLNGQSEASQNGCGYPADGGERLIFSFQGDRRRFV